MAFQIAHGHRLRKGRFSEPGRVYQITTVTWQRRPIFRDLQCGRLVVAALHGEEPRATTLAFVIMPDHIHWLMQIKELAPLENVVGTMKSVSAHRIRKATSLDGAIWQKGYHDHALRKEENLATVGRYIIENPLRAGIVNDLANYPLWDAIWI